MSTIVMVWQWIFSQYHVQVGNSKSDHKVGFLNKYITVHFCDIVINGEYATYFDFRSSNWLQPYLALEDMEIYSPLQDW